MDHANDLTQSLRAALEQQDGDIDEIDLLSNDNLLRIAPELCGNPATLESLHTLRDLQKAHDEIFAEYIREKQELENKYESLFVPVFMRRKTELDATDIEHFWYRAFQNCEVLRENITEKDAVALRYLQDVSCETVTSGSREDSPISMPIGSFTLRLKFRDNPFFENDVLTKTYVMDEDDFEDLAEARGCKVLWKPGKDLTVRTLKKKTKNGRVLIKKQPTDSFFNFFSPPQGVDPEADMDPAVVEELEDVMDADLELGECIRSEVVPRALLYFLDIAEGGGEDGNNAVEDEEADEDEDEDEDDEEGDARVNADVLPPPASPSPEDCKQQ